MKHLIEECEQEGYQARKDGKMRVVNQRVMDLIGNGPVGQRRTRVLMEAFYAGWQRHEDEEMRALGFPVSR